MSSEVFNKAAAITASDSTAVSYKAIYVGGAGNIKLTLGGNTDAEAVTLTAVPVGTWLYLRVKKVWSTGTTATNLVGFTSSIGY